MADLDQLSIQITSDSQKAEESIQSLIRGLNDLNSAISKLDTGNIRAFSNAVNRLSKASIGDNLVESFKKISDLKFPDLSGAAQAISQVQKSANNVGGTAPKVQELSTATKSIQTAAQDASDGVLVLRDSLNGLGNTKKVTWRVLIIIFKFVFKFLN